MFNAEIGGQISWLIPAALILLAAGRSQRFGIPNKLEVPFLNKPVGLHVVTAFESIPFRDRLVVTDVDVEVDGDTWAPSLDDAWTCTARTPDTGWSESATGGLRYAVSEYQRADATGTEPPRAAR